MALILHDLGRSGALTRPWERRIAPSVRRRVGGRLAISSGTVEVVATGWLRSIRGSLRSPPRRLSAVRAVLITLFVTAVLSWFESGTRTFTWQAESIVSVPVAAMFIVSALNRPKRISLRAWARALRRSAGSRPGTEAAGPKEAAGPTGLLPHACSPVNRASAVELRTSLAVWLLWCVAVIVLELVELFYLPRSQHPTMSSIIAPFLADSRPVHAAAFFAWMWIGALFSARW